MQQTQPSYPFELRPWRSICVVSNAVSYTCKHGPTIQVRGGDYVIFQGPGYISLVGKVLNINANEGTLEVQVFMFGTSVPNHEQHIPPLDGTKYNFVSGMVEVVETNRIICVNTSSLTDFAFIFHVDLLQSGFYSSHGMENAFYIRYRMFERRLRHNNNQLFAPDISVLDAKHFLSFFHESNVSLPESAHHQAFQVLTMVKRQIDQLLWTERKYKQGSGVVRSVPVPLFKQGWDYLKFRFGRRGIPVIEKVTARGYKTYFSDLSSAMLSLQTTICKIEAHTSEELATVRSILGSGVGFGCRRPKPRKKDGICRLQIHEQVNVIEFTFNSEESAQPTEVDHSESCPIPNSLTLLYDTKQNMFSVRIYHSYLRVSSSRGQLLMQEINHSLASLSLGTTIMIGSTFSRDGVYLETIELVRDGIVRCKNMVTDEEVMVNANEAQQLIDASN